MAHLRRAYLRGRRRELLAHAKTAKIAREFVTVSVAEVERIRTLLDRAMELNDAIQTHNDLLLAELEHYRRADTEPDQRNTLH
jgi:hypothetical protein